MMGMSKSTVGVMKRCGAQIQTGGPPDRTRSKLIDGPTQKEGPHSAFNENYLVTRSRQLCSPSMLPCRSSPKRRRSRQGHGCAAPRTTKAPTRAKLAKPEPPPPASTLWTNWASPAIAHVTDMPQLTAGRARHSLLLKHGLF